MRICLRIHFDFFMASVDIIINPVVCQLDFIRFVHVHVVEFQPAVESFGFLQHSKRNHNFSDDFDYIFIKNIVGLPAVGSSKNPYWSINCLKVSSGVYSVININRSNCVSISAR